MVWLTLLETQDTQLHGFGQKELGTAMRMAYHIIYVSFAVHCLAVISSPGALQVCSSLGIIDHQHPL